VVSPLRLPRESLVQVETYNLSDLWAFISNLGQVVVCDQNIEYHFNLPIVQTSYLRLCGLERLAFRDMMVVDAFDVKWVHNTRLMQNI
jgi:hypothetical protein